MTLPSGTEVLTCWVITPTARFALTSALVAAAWLRPATFGTVTSARVTSKPRWIWVKLTESGRYLELILVQGPVPQIKINPFYIDRALLQ